MAVCHHPALPSDFGDCEDAACQVQGQLEASAWLSPGTEKGVAFEVLCAPWQVLPMAYGRTGFRV